MAQFRGTFRFKELEVAEYKKAVKAIIEKQIRIAARAFVRAAVVKIPVVTGMARGSFLNIGRYLRIHIPIRPTKRIRTRGGYTWRERDRWYYLSSGARIPKTPESGAALTPFEFLVTDKRIGFKVNSKVFHYTLQDEFSGRSPTAPWHSMKAGREAFMEEMRKIKSKLPNIEDYLVETTISFGPGARGLSITRGSLRIRKVESG